MATVITVANHKGGTGKTTLSIALYQAFTKSGTNCLLVDTDPQRSIINTNTQLDAGLNVIDEIDTEKIQKHTISIIDTEPSWTLTTEKAVQLANIVLLPFTPSMLDAMATIQTVIKIRADQPEKKVFAVVNMAMSGTGFNNDVKELLESKDIPTLSVTVGSRIAFKRSMFSTANIYKEKDQKAKAESDALAMEIYSKLIS